MTETKTDAWPWGLVVAGGSAVVVGSFMPWLTITTGLGQLERSGVDGGGDGLFTAGAGVALVLLGLAARSGSTRAKRIGVLVVAGALGVLTYFEFSWVQERIDEVSGLVNGELGAGLYVIAAGVVGAGIGGLMLLSDAPQSTQPELSAEG